MQKNNKFNNSKTIFTDCFNTIIGRTKTANDVLFDWACEMNKIYNNCPQIEFFKLFKRSWNNLKRYDVLEKENSEFLLDIKLIFSEIYFVLQNSILNNVNKNAFIEQAFNVYFNAEHNSHYLKKETIKYLNKKREQGFKIYLVSDFYCNKEIIKKWLELLSVNCEYLFDNIFVSCDLQKSKNTGSIYYEIIKLENLDFKNITMIGDNFWADGIMAHKAGLKTKFVFPQIKRDCKSIQKSKTTTNVPSQLKQIFDMDINQSSYSNNAFPLFLFAKRLADSCIRKKITNLFFLAREGKFLKTIFDYYCFENNLDIKTNYLYISRKSVLNTSCKNFEESFIGLANLHFLTCVNFLKSLSFNNDEIKLIMEDAGITYKGPYFKFNTSKDYQALLNSKKFNCFYQKIRSNQRASYTKYLEGFNVDLYNEGFYVVDSGWVGNMQRYIKNYFDKKINLQGFYIGNINKNSVKENLYGLLFAPKLKGTNYQDKILSYRRFNWEEFLRTETGSCKGYDVNTNLPILEDSPTETSAYYKYIQPLQNKIFEKFKLITQECKTNYCDIDAVCTNMYYQMIKRTSKADRNLFVEIQSSYFDGFGYFELKYSLISKTLRKLNFYVRDKMFLIKHYKDIKRKRLV
ncbi:MAG: HAD hydrolase-like protein [Clostridia bacterium]